MNASKNFIIQIYVPTGTKWVATNVEVRDLKEQYCQAASAKAQSQQMLDWVQKDLIQTAKGWMATQETIRNCINKIKEIAPQPEYFGCSDENLELMIISEES